MRPIVGRAAGPAQRISAALWAGARVHSSRRGNRPVSQCSIEAPLAFTRAMKSESQTVPSIMLGGSRMRRPLIPALISAAVLVAATIVSAMALPTTARAATFPHYDHIFLIVNE